MAIQKGTKVRQVIKPLEGTVTGFSVDQETGKLLTKVEWADEQGVEHAKFFDNADLEEVIVEDESPTEE
jgi:hypothetical protein